MQCPVFGDNGPFGVARRFFTFGYPRLYPGPESCLQTTLDAWSPPFPAFHLLLATPHEHRPLRHLDWLSTGERRHLREHEDARRLTGRLVLVHGIHRPPFARLAPHPQHRSDFSGSVAFLLQPHTRDQRLPLVGEQRRTRPCVV